MVIAGTSRNWVLTITADKYTTTYQYHYGERSTASSKCSTALIDFVDLTENGYLKPLSSNPVINIPSPSEIPMRFSMHS